MTLSLEETMLALEYIYPGCERVISNGAVVWLDERPYPTETELEAAAASATMERAIAAKLELAEAFCDAKLQEGLPYTFGTVEEVVQTRMIDKVNLLAIAIEARHLDNIGISAPFTPLRVESNNQYWITPQEGLAITTAALEHIIEKYRRCWMYKDAIRSATTLQELEAVEWYEGPLP